MTRTPEEWNLLFDSSGHTWPELQGMLASGTGYILVRSEEELAKDQTGQYGEALTPVFVRPGEALGDDASSEIGDRIEAHWGIESVGFGSYGFPPLPYRTAGWVRRGGISGIGHPVFWLPPESRLFGQEVFLSGRYPWHGPSLEQIRLCLELMVRGYMDLDTGDVQDALVSIGIDPLSPPWSTLTLMVRDKYEDRPEFCRDLALPLPEDVSSARVVSWWAAERAVEMARQMHVLYLDADHVDVNARLFNAWRFPDEVDVPLVLEAFEKAGREYAADPSTTTIADLLVAVDTTVTLIGDIAFSSALYMEDAVHYRSRGFTYLGDSPTADERARTQGELSELETTTKAALYATKGKTQQEISTALTAAWNELATVAHRWLMRAKEVTTKVSPVVRSEFTAPPPQPLEVPPDVRPEIERINEAAKGLAV
jgi:hypothetical protein